MTTFTITRPVTTIRHMLAALRASLPMPVRVCAVPNGFDRATGMLTLRVAMLA